MLETWTQSQDIFVHFPALQPQTIPCPLCPTWVLLLLRWRRAWKCQGMPRNGKPRECQGMPDSPRGENGPAEPRGQTPAESFQFLRARSAWNVEGWWQRKGLRSFQGVPDPGTGTKGQEVLPQQSPPGLCLKRGCGEEPSLQERWDGESRSWWSFRALENRDKIIPFFFPGAI